VLEEIWSAAEVGRALTISALSQTIHAGPSDGWGGVVQELLEEGLLTVEGQELCLTDSGATRAKEVVRRHRLAEILFHQVFELPMRTTEQQACTIEHILTDQVTDAVCSFLGHPPVCPHGRPIPPGRCCDTLSRQVDPLISRLLDQQPGGKGRVVLVAPRHRDRFEQLADLGIVPGAVLTVRQRKPSIVVLVDSTLLALEDELAAGIYVRPLVEW
jgi:DtxR family transcriptional regulator, Mn-dependent transcriptional regulator